MWPASAQSRCPVSIRLRRLSHPLQTVVSTAPIQEIHSSSTELLTSATLKEVKNLIATAYKQHEEIASELDSAQTSKVDAEAKFSSWENGFVFKHVFKKIFAKRREAFETESARVAELEEQLKLSRIATQIDLENEQADLFFRLRDQFAALTECAAIWDVKTRQATDKFHERTTASTRLAARGASPDADVRGIIVFAAMNE